MDDFQLPIREAMAEALAQLQDEEMMKDYEEQPMIGALASFQAPSGPLFLIRPSSPTDEIVIREIWTENVYRVALADIEGGVVIDVGANIGAFTSFALSLGARRVVAIEPEPDNRRMFRANLAVLESRIWLSERAIWSSTGQVRLTPNQGGTQITPDGPLSVSACTLSDLFVEAFINECAVLKMDIEGAEYEVLRVTPSALLAKVRYLTMEFHSTDAETFGALVAKLSLTHAVQTLGSYERGGYIYARKY